MANYCCDVRCYSLRYYYTHSSPYTSQETRWPLIDKGARYLYTKEVKKPISKTVTLETIVGGGQTLGTLEDGKKVFAWGGLPGEKVIVSITKNKSRLAQGIVS